MAIYIEKVKLKDILNEYFIEICFIILSGYLIYVLSF